MSRIVKNTSISEYHKVRGLPKPEHPLISLVDMSLVRQSSEYNDVFWINDFYSISMKRNLVAKYRYGQQPYDFDEGIMYCIEPGQLFNVRVPDDFDPATMQPTGWMLLIHPDFLWGSALAAEISKYEFFDYKVNEALFLSDKEEQTILAIFQKIKEEYNSNIDKFSQKIIIAQIELLLTYADRFYQRQFITRKITNHRVLESLEKVLDEFFNDEQRTSAGLPTVQFVSEQLNLSPNYLSGLLKSLTGQSTQQHIHGKLLEKAKIKLSTSEKSVSEIGYELGFEHPQSFSKFFKSMTNQSPVQFRQSFN